MVCITKLVLNKFDLLPATVCSPNLFHINIHSHIKKFLTKKDHKQKDHLKKFKKLICSLMEAVPSHYHCLPEYCNRTDWGSLN